MVSNTHTHTQKSDSDMVPERPQKPHNGSKKRLLALAFVTAFIASDISNCVQNTITRVQNAMKNRPESLRDYIRKFSDKDFVTQRTKVNSDYYQQKGIHEVSDVRKLSQSLTKLDIMVNLFHSGKLTETDFLHHIVTSNERIVTEEGVGLDRVYSYDGQSVRVEGYLPSEDTMTAFVTNYKEDANNPEKKKYSLTISPRSQGGGYILSFEDAGKKRTLELAFRLFR